MKVEPFEVTERSWHRVRSWATYWGRVSLESRARWTKLEQVQRWGAVLLRDGVLRTPEAVSADPWGRKKF